MQPSKRRKLMSGMTPIDGSMTRADLYLGPGNVSRLLFRLKEYQILSPVRKVRGIRRGGTGMDHNDPAVCVNLV